ncbi:MAG: UDP-N-acetylmuramoyl-L-alanyl-D-glutamate--2,6-diaminopimelate ligase [Verrucomicrobiaceae bacterium]|nr:UDP-N-acetylmuramoyl-L-alanyl-D-glutamate--2,6-diaminopimelate ligase [Verrucomicrobiaceae bacterium]
MKAFNNLHSLICLCGAKHRFASLSFAQSDLGSASYTVEDLAKAVGAIKLTGDKTAEIKMLIADSRRVAPATAFFAVSGINTDGNKFVEEAAHRGACTIVSENPAPKLFPAAWIQVKNMAEAMAKAGKSFYGNSTESLKTIGITGTNGKTSVSWMVQKMLTDTKTKCGLIGTIHYDLGGRCLPASRTTPEALELHAMLSQMRFAECKAVAMEISSHAIAQKRVEGIDLDCACFLNLTQDHLDYHKTIDAYFRTKASIFTGELGTVPKSAVINIDDPYGRKITTMLTDKTTPITFGIESTDALIRAKDIVMLPKKSTFTLVSPEGEIEVVVNMPGHYNILNALAGISIIYAVGGDIKSAVKALADFGGVPGRMQKVSGNAKFDIFVDYAHTDDALRNGLSMLKNVVKGRILVVFGCGGKRDRTKRPLMVKAVQDFADIAWATSDNPRGEALDQIFDDMKKGITNPDKICFIEDRRRAINLAIEAATDGDCILIAGKGHETFQELGDTIIPFDDKRIAEELLSLKQII